MEYIITICNCKIILLRERNIMKTIIKNVNKIFSFKDEKGYEVLVDGFKDGFATIRIPITVTRYEDKISACIVDGNNLISFLSGCFGKESNFVKMLFETYECDSTAEFLGFKLKAGDMSCTVTRENSAFYSIKEIIENFLGIYAEAEAEKINKRTDEYNKEREDLDNLLDSLDIAFKSDQAEDKYIEEAERLDENFLGYGQDFVAHVQYLVEQEGYNISDAVNETYRRFDSISFNIEEGLASIQFICRFCLYGDEIYESYFNIWMKMYNDELNNYL